jgi:hypothetical protein
LIHPKLWDAALRTLRGFTRALLNIPGFLLTHLFPVLPDENEDSGETQDEDQHHHRGDEVYFCSLRSWHIERIKD